MKCKKVVKNVYYNPQTTDPHIDEDQQLLSGINN